ncbi:MAG: phospholipase D-like domain-containing protein [Verrucomicrobia bacterium]|nr:phospholipase D-like domain-containing protein [Verrucomicrobiota bacterium]
MRSILLLTLLLSACATGRHQKLAKNVGAVTTTSFANEMSRITGQPWSRGNTVTALPNGGNFIPAMLKAIRGAQKTVTWENFVCVDCQPVENFTDAFIERAKAGVKVHVILDDYGCNTYGKHHLKAMREAGVDLHLYSRWSWLNPFRYNHRTHRRILVVDGKIGFVGGAGLAYAWDGHAEDSLRWRDSMYEVRGPVVTQLQEAFNDNWQELAGSRLLGPDYFPELSSSGSLQAQSVLGSPKKSADRIGSSFLLALRSAQHSILISHAYFIPNRPIIQALLEARSRGVQIEMLIPGDHTDMPICQSVTQPLLQRLITAGVEVYEFQPCMMHGKLLVIDDQLSIIGSGNIDQRSFFINDENNLLVLDAEFAKKQRVIHEQDKKRSQKLTPDHLKLPPLRHIQGFFGRLVQHQL